MRVQSSDSVASRLGYALGRAARFMLADRNFVLRWMKRAALAGSIILIILEFSRSLGSVILTLLTLSAAVIALSRVGTSETLSDDLSHNISNHPSIPREGDYGYGYYDSYGNFRGSSNPFDED